MANGSDKDDYESSGEEKSNGDNVNHEDDDDQPTRFEAGRSTSGRRVPRFVLLQARKKNSRRFQSQTLLKLHVFSIDSFQ